MQARRIGGNADEVARGLRERLAALEPVTAAELEAVLQALRRNGDPRLAHQIVSDHDTSPVQTPPLALAWLRAQRLAG